MRPALIFVALALVACAPPAEPRDASADRHIPRTDSAPDVEEPLEDVFFPPADTGAPMDAAPDAEPDASAPDAQPIDANPRLDAAPDTRDAGSDARDGGSDARDAATCPPMWGPCTFGGETICCFGSNSCARNDSGRPFCRI